MNGKIGIEMLISLRNISKKVGEYGYLGACNATLGKGFGQLGGQNAVAFSTGYGDGLYPVYADITEDGRVGYSSY
jgi:hypothetical protein